MIYSSSLHNRLAGCQSCTARGAGARVIIIAKNFLQVFSNLLLLLRKQAVELTTLYPPTPRSKPMKAVPVMQMDVDSPHKTTHYVLSHPMCFQISESVPGQPDSASRAEEKYAEFSNVVVVEVPGVVPRVVIHAATVDEVGHISYGFAQRRVDGISNGQMALMLQGYQVD
jgi:hypothetical protein